jgi:hypothetical protein
MHGWDVERRPREIHTEPHSAAPAHETALMPFLTKKANRLNCHEIFFRWARTP